MTRMSDGTVNKRRGVIYCRVSTKEQVSNYSLKNQEKACREYAERKKWEVVECFIESGESAKTADRPVLRELIDYITKNKEEIDFVLVQRVDRLGRNTLDVSSLIQLFAKSGIKFDSVDENFDDTPMGKYILTIISAMAQLDNDIKAERTITGMRNALIDGRWVACAPVGYEFEGGPGQKTNLVPDEKARFVIKAFELCKTGLHKQSEIVRILKDDGFETVSTQLINNMLRNPIYTGIMRHRLLEEPVRGSYEPLISEDSFYLVQDVLDGRNPSIKRRNRNNPDYPLKGLLKCSHCKKPLTASTSRGNGGRYPYYHCHRGCGTKSIRKEVIENKFVGLLRKIAPGEDTMKLFIKIMEDVWNEKHKDRKQYEKRLNSELNELEIRRQRIIDKGIDGYFNKDTFREQMRVIESKITERERKLGKTVAQLDDIGAFMDYCEYFLRNLSELWEKGDIKLRQRFQSIIFPEGIYYDNGSIGTNKISLVFQLFELEDREESKVVPPAGFEPALTDQ